MASDMSKSDSDSTNPLTISNQNDVVSSINDRLDTMLANMNSQFASLRTDLNDSIQFETKTIQDSLDSFKQEIQGKFDTFKTEVNLSIKNIESDVDKHSNAIDTHRSKLTVVSNEILQCQVDINDQEQRQRNNSVKITGFKVQSGSVGRAVFAKLILPVVDIAYKREDPDRELPTYHQTCHIAHVLPSKPDRIPTIQFRFLSRDIRETFLNNKKAFLIDFNKKHSSNVEVKKDYTAINKSCMSALYDHPSVDHFWMSGSTIKFVTKDDLNTTKEVKNPLEDDPEKMIIPI